MSQSTMTSDRWTEVADLERLTGLLGEPSALVRHKARSALTDVDIAWIEASPFCVVGSASASGHADVSPKGDPAGQLVHVIEIDELFHHCAKAFLRSSLWQPETWDPEAVVARRRAQERLRALVEELVDLDDVDQLAGRVALG